MKQEMENGENRNDENKTKCNAKMFYLFGRGRVSCEGRVYLVVFSAYSVETKEIARAKKIRLKRPDKRKNKRKNQSHTDKRTEMRVPRTQYRCDMSVLCPYSLFVVIIDRIPFVMPSSYAVVSKNFL